MREIQAGDRDKSTLEKVLGVVTDVRPGEGVTALLLTLDVFLLLTAYYVVKPVREGLVLDVKGGAEYKSYMGAAIAITLLFAVPIYARIARRLPRGRLLLAVNAFFVSNLLLFFFAMHAGFFSTGTGATLMALGFFLWVGVFNMMVIAQFWSFANDIYSEEQGKRLFALVGLGASLGATFGSLVLSEIVQSIGTRAMLLLGAAALSASAVLTEIVHRRAAKAARSGVVSSRAPGAPPAGNKGAFALVFKHKYLLLIAIFSVVFTLVNTNGEYILSRLVKDRAAGLGGSDAKDWIAAYYGRFFFFVNVLGLLLQTFVVSRIIRYLPLRRGFLIFPLIAMASAVSVAFFPLLAVYRFGKTAENATDYSLNNTIRNTLWLPTTREMKYVAKQAIDSFFVRFGDVLSALVVFVFAETLGVGVRTIALINVGLVSVWIFVALGVAREHARLSSAREPAEIPRGAAQPQAA